MGNGFILNERDTILRFIKRAVEDTDDLKTHVISLEKGHVLFRQGETLPYLYLLLEGSVQLSHTRKDQTSFDLVKLEPGHFVGLVAFTTGNQSLTTCRVLEKVKALRIEQEEFEQYINDHPRLRHPLQQLMVSNMTDRFMKNVELEAKMNALNKKLEHESADLKKAYQQLEASQQMLIHQEKMATLGELVAGFAHEVNNPASALLRSSASLNELFSVMPQKETDSRMFGFGLRAGPVSSSVIRERMKKLRGQFDKISERALLRKLAQMPKQAVDLVHEQSAGNPEQLKALIRQFEAGKLIHNIQVASERIANLVKSLKSYSRQDRNEAEMIDIREGIKDTLLVLSHRLKFIDVQLELNEIPKTCGNMGELNQVWTNIIVNACDAMPDDGRLSVCTRQERKRIIVEISDNGPGIPDKVMNRIFEPNFTTKNQGAEFGLGLGLAISNQIIRQHGGEIHVANNHENGARFTILLPVKAC